jgi:tetratricopeptide (TPR) repeat protein
MDISILDSGLVVPESVAGAADPLNNLLNQVATRTLLFRLILARVATKGTCVVDLGAGPCLFAKIARDEGCAVTAVDARTVRKPSDTDLGSIRFVHADVREFDLAGFDLIVFLGLLYHFDWDDQLRVLEKCARAGVPVVLETQVHFDSLVAPTETRSWAREIVTRGKYEGVLFPENDNPMASVGNAISFWPTEPSLLLMLEDAGFKRAAIVDPLYQSKYGARRFYVLNGTPDLSKAQATSDIVRHNERLKVIDFVNRGHFDEARRLSAQLDPGPFGAEDWLFGIATVQLQLQLGAVTDAIETIGMLRDHALEFGATAHEAFFRCADLFKQAGNADEAKKTRAMAYERIQNPNILKSLLHRSAKAGSLEDCSEMLALIGERFSSDTALLTLGAKVALQVGNTEDFERICRIAMSSDSANVAMLERLGHLLIRRREMDQAASVLGRALTLSPDNTRILERIIPVHLELNRLDEVEREAKHLVSIAPLNPLGHLYLASFFKRVRRRPEALKHAMRAAALEPGNERYSRYVAQLSQPRTGGRSV